LLICQEQNVCCWLSFLILRNNPFFKKYYKDFYFYKAGLLTVNINSPQRCGDKITHIFMEQNKPGAFFKNVLPVLNFRAFVPILFYTIFAVLILK
jgi:hypothetical protein